MTTTPGGLSTHNADSAVSPVDTHCRLRKDRRWTAKLVRQLSEDSIQSPTMVPEFVVLEVRQEFTEVTVRKTVYVTDMSGTKTLDLYSGWNPENQKHKLPLKVLPIKVCQIVTLERLWVSHNKLSTLPPQLDQLRMLRELFLHRNNFEEIPSCVCRLSSLQVLWFSNNKIKSIPDEIAQMSSLKRLHLDNNFIKALPKSLCELTQLEVLYLNHNAIHHLSESIGKLHNLKRLYLQHNKITELPTGITRLKSIVLLLLEDNEIRNVKREFSLYQANMEALHSVVSIKNNPYIAPHSKFKLSLAGIGGPPTLAQLKTRRYSDQHEREVNKRPDRVSLPLTSDKKEQVEDYKADTLPRSSPMSHPKRSAFNEL